MRRTEPSEPISPKAGSALTAAVAALVIPVIVVAVGLLSESTSSCAPFAVLSVILGGSSALVALLLGFVIGLDRRRQPRERRRGWRAVFLAFVALALNGALGLLLYLLSTPLLHY